MKTLFSFFLFFQCAFLSAQQLENHIYKAIDEFVAVKDQKALQILEEKEKQFIRKVATKNEQLALVILQCNKGYYLKRINEKIKAIATYENAWKRFSENQLSNYNIIEYCLKPLGNLYIKVKDYTNAENSIKYYIFLAKKQHDKELENAGVINLAKMYQTAGNHKLAVKLINTALKSKVNKDQKEKLEVIKATSLIILKKYNQINFLPVQKATVLKVNSYNQYHLQYKIALEKKEYKKALHFFNLAKKKHLKSIVSIRDKAKENVEEAQLYYLVSNFKKAKESLDRALKILLPSYNEQQNIVKEMLYAENIFIDIFDIYAHLQQDDLKAIQIYDKSFYVANLLENEITSQEAKIIHQAENRKRSETCIKIFLNLYRKTANISFLEQAFYYAEKSKSSILDEVINRKILVKKHPKDSLLIRQQKLLQEQEVLTNQLINQQVLNLTSISNSELSKQLHLVSIQLKRIQEKINKRYNSIQKESFLVKELQYQLKKRNATLVEYFYGKKILYQFIITKNTIHVYEIALQDKIKEILVEYIRFFENPYVINNNVSEYIKKSYQTYKTLLLENVSNAKNVIIVPDGILNFIPFETLLTKTTTKTNFAEMPFLLKKQNIVYNLSVKFFLKEYPKTKNKKVLGVFPVFKDTNDELKHSINEARYINEEVPSLLLMNEKATKESFIKKNANYKILHLSTHATSGDYITPATIRFYDEKLTLNELYSLQLTAELVVLSACETGVGKLQKGEGAMSIARGFQYAGVKNTLFSLWKINDKSTSILMKEFYKTYKKSLSIDYANRNSKIEYLQNKDIDNIKKSPYYWGAFVYYGTIKPVNSKDKSYIIGIVFLIIISLAFKSKFTKN